VPSALSHSIDISCEPNASTWLSAILHDFILYKSDFRDALCLRYGWIPALLPKSCVRGVSFNNEHALSCPREGFLCVRHNDICDSIAHLHEEICHDVSVEPGLQPLTGGNLHYLGLRLMCWHNFKNNI